MEEAARDERIGQSRHRKRISILMRVPKEQALIEFPLQSAREEDKRSKTIASGKKNLLNSKNQT